MLASRRAQVPAQVAVWLFGLGLAAGCSASSSFACEADAQCVAGGVAGVCTEIRHCAYPDPACETGYRFPTGAGSLGGMCVPTTPGSTGSTGTTGSSGTTGTTGSTGTSGTTATGSSTLSSSTTQPTETSESSSAEPPTTGGEGGSTGTGTGTGTGQADGDDAPLGR